MADDQRRGERGREERQRDRQVRYFSTLKTIAETLNNGVSLRDASHLAGIGTWELEDKVRVEFGLTEKQLSVFGIGPAGENLVKFACFAGDRGHVASHNGVGAVLGAKKLKAISVKRGRTRPHIADPKKLNDLANPLFVDARDYAGGGLYNWGTAGGLSGAARGGWLNAGSVLKFP